MNYSCKERERERERKSIKTDKLKGEFNVLDLGPKLLANTPKTLQIYYVFHKKHLYCSSVDHEYFNFKMDCELVSHFYDPPSKSYHFSKWHPYDTCKSHLRISLKLLRQARQLASVQSSLFITLKYTFLIQTFLFHCPFKCC